MGKKKQKNDGKTKQIRQHPWKEHNVSNDGLLSNLRKRNKLVHAAAKWL